MEYQSREKRRAANIIWNASGDYSFWPDFDGYDGAGKADLYWNYIVGAAHRYYDYPQLQRFFAFLQQDPNHVFYESLTWIGLENCTYQRGKSERPVLEELRRRYSLRVLRKEDAPSLYYLVDEIKRAHFQRALGEEPNVREQVDTILRDLEFDASMTTEQIILAMNHIIADHFPLHPASGPKTYFKHLFPGLLNLRFNGENSRFSNPFRGSSFLRLFNVEAASISGEPDHLETEHSRGKRPASWQKLKDLQERKQRENVQKDYGRSILPEAQTKALERILCVGNHKNCRLHFTRGEFETNAATGAGSQRRKELALQQREKNQADYKKNLARNNHSIDRLTHVIRNTMLVAPESSAYRAKTGSLVTAKVWRNIYLYDSKVFLKNAVDDLGDLAVDILLDASGSQIERQEVIASQGYIIAESLKRCQIPVRIYSFCTNGIFTIINLFRDYGEANANERVFNYYASGCNRDGLAIRTALHMMEEFRCEHRILIVLSDGKPVDPQGISNGGADPDRNFYADILGVSDTAAEVRKGRQDGISILCVYTGLDEDFPAARKIYGSGLVRIKSPEKFVDVVGVLIRNELLNH